MGIGVSDVSSNAGEAGVSFRVLTVMFWIATTICVVTIAASSFTGSVVVVDDRGIVVAGDAELWRYRVVGIQKQP